MTASARPRPSAPRTTKSTRYAKQAKNVAVQRAVRPRPKALRLDAAAEGGHVRDWLDAGCEGFRGMRTVRPQSWGIQGTVDGLHDAGVFGREGSLRADVPVGAAREDGGPPLGAALRTSAAQLLAPLIGFDLPAGLIEQVKQDAAEVGVVVAELLPATDTLALKLELMRENVCVRWHQDHYAARAIVSYNCCGTEYVHDDAVDFWELHNCGNNDCVVRDRTRVCQAGVGDILFVKGKKHPGIVNGLVHRSPDHVYHPDGVVKTRLVLKVDAMAAW